MADNIGTFGCERVTPPGAYIVGGIGGMEWNWQTTNIGPAEINKQTRPRTYSEESNHFEGAK
jgi:hypothetical protein